MMEPETFTLLSYFKLGGIFMWPLLFFSIIAVSIVLGRIVYFLYHDLNLTRITPQVRSFIEAGNIPGAKSYLSDLSKRRMGARVLLALINRSGLPEHRIEKAVEAEAQNCINSLEWGLNSLTALGSLSPLTGFLGTVSGMIGAFKSISEAVEVNAQIVANGIYEALITTVFGLIIAIIAMAAHSVFTHMVDAFAAKLEKDCSDLIETMLFKDGA
jgi:biopolymer transport protein ExbB